MQYRPTAPELLTALADLLETTLLPALPPELRHQARVGAHLARMLERELTFEAGLEPPTEAVPGLEDAAGIDSSPSVGVASGRASEAGRADGTVAAVSDETDAGLADDDLRWAALVPVVRADLAVAKPGYDAWEGE